MKFRDFKEKVTKWKTFYEGGGTELVYKGDGHSGYQDPAKGWKTGCSCYSTICQDKTNSIVKIKMDCPLTEVEFNQLIVIIKDIGKPVRDMLNENPPSYKNSTMEFTDKVGGFAKYFAFILWRYSYRTPVVFYAMKYFHDMGYSTAESYVLMSHRLCSLGKYTGWLSLITNKYKKGVVKRLSNVCRYRRGDASYSMRKTMCQDDFYRWGRDVEKKHIVIPDAHSTDKLIPKHYKKENLDKILQEAL